VPFRDDTRQGSEVAQPSPAVFDAGLVALDASPIGMILADAEMRVLYTNAAAARVTGDRRSGVRIRYAGAVSVLTAEHRGDAAALRSLTAAAANAGVDGAMKLQSPDIDDGRPAAVAITVTPVPAGLVKREAAGGDSDDAPGVALITLLDLAAPEAPAASVLSEMFQLSAAEAAVAEALVGGATAESVAEARQVSLHTVRRQIQDVLRKTEATNLRDLERMAAMLATMPGPARSPRAEFATMRNLQAR
jgi:DNA-binding CsgD family transcriptional regulator